ncbi:hypothetical protein C0Q70_13255 [Pomacea canaliculata]|uniref:Uncharacterized protein n=1 Tax=Pomacea canaliculata TaxID=400727 RepID=A0A2T7NWR7_POMCA|nr:hypothetical protein C0Q70_13255 [Pomacea canaliculata]
MTVLHPTVPREGDNSTSPMFLAVTCNVGSGARVPPPSPPKSLCSSFSSFSNFSGLNPDGTSLRLTASQIQSRVSFMYSLDDPEALVLHVERKKQRLAEWRKRMTEEEAALKEEAAQHGDLLFVDVVDVYRALPSKLLHCHAWYACLDTLASTCHSSLDVQ